MEKTDNDLIKKLDEIGVSKINNVSLDDIKINPIVNDLIKKEKHNLKLNFSLKSSSSPDKSILIEFNELYYDISDLKK